MSNVLIKIKDTNTNLIHTDAHTYTPQKVSILCIKKRTPNTIFSQTFKTEVSSSFTLYCSSYTYTILRYPPFLFKIKFKDGVWLSVFRSTRYVDSNWVLGRRRSGLLDEPHDVSLIGISKWVKRYPLMRGPVTSPLVHPTLY